MITPDTSCDLLVVGGGINGVGIARDAQGRGLRVVLVEQGDLAGATSSASSKLIHGGLRYLEHYEFRLVREALAEREVLLRLAPHIIWPLTFVLPHDAAMRPAWMIRAGLFLYDHLARRNTLAGSHRIDLGSDRAGLSLKREIRTGFVYSDCWVEDSRLVVLTALGAKEKGARIRTRCRFLGASRVATDAGERWRADIETRGSRETIFARGLVNAGGPWVQQVLAATAGGPDQPAGREPERPHVRLIKGSHIVVPRLHEGQEAFLLQNSDGRVVFVIPYEGRYSLIGTTDVAYSGDPAAAAISAEETAYLCAAVARVFARPPSAADVVWSYAGVRPLYDDAAGDPSAITRDYVLELQAEAGQAPLLSVYGGKITTYRRLAEQALDKLSAHLGCAAKPWTADAPLPGGDMANADFDAFLASVRKRWPWLAAPLSLRLARAYGTRIDLVLGGAKTMAELGRDLGAGLAEREAEYLVAHEWAAEPADILWRRTKLGLHGGPDLERAVAGWLGARNEAPLR